MMMIIVQIVIGVRLLTLASLRSDALLRLRLLLMVVIVTSFLPESITYRHLFISFCLGIQTPGGMLRGHRHGWVFLLGESAVIPDLPG